MGRPPFDPVLMFKILVIQATNNLSDERAEFSLGEKLFTRSGPTLTPTRWARPSASPSRPWTSRCGICVASAHAHHSISSLGAAVPNSAWVEFIPQLDVVTKSRIEIVDGYAVPSSDIGLCISWDWKAIERMRIGQAIISQAT